MGLRPLYKYFNSSSVGTVFITLESDVYRRQILTHKDGPSAEMINVVSFFSSSYDHIIM